MQFILFYTARKVSFSHWILSLLTLISILFRKLLYFTYLHVFPPLHIQVKPIVGNKAIEAVDNITYKENLPFPTISQENLTSLSSLELEQHLTVVYKFLQKTVLAAQSNTVVNTVVSGVLADRVNAISYLYNIATSAEVSYFTMF